MSADRRFIAVKDLLIDRQNPRLEIAQGQDEIVAAMANAQGSLLVVLARDIVEYGVNPSELPLVIPANSDQGIEDGSGKYVVIEGNRRITVLKILANPDLVASLDEPLLTKHYMKLSKQFQESPIDALECVVLSGRERAHHWVMLRHIGQQGGAGVVRWKALESERYTARTGPTSPQLQVVHFVQEKGYLSEKAKENLGSIKFTNLQRLIEDRDVQEQIGFAIRDGKVETRLDEAEVAKPTVSI